MGALFFPLVALIQAASAYPADVDCSNSGDGSPYAMNQCIYSQSQEWDRRLNAEYRAAMNRVDVDKAKLRASQRIWLQYRDANCDVYAAVKGSDGKLLANACWRDMTRARTLELREMGWTG
jgi:uncharacterized protein YecT (DUF1311 family)